MKIQGILDLSGFELQNFCIQNYTDKANVANIGRGRKFFFTGNSTDQDYNREVIWDGDKWRASAYLDDIDKIKEKLDLIFGDELDTDTIIDSWKEVQDFLSGIEDTKNLMTMLDGKLDTKGGTINGTTVNPLNINTTNETEVGIYFQQNNTKIAWVGYSASAGTGIYDVATKSILGITIAGVPHFNNKILLHSGNVGDYALKVDGSNAMTDGLQLLTMSSGSTNVAVTEGLFIYRGPSSGGTDVDLPDNYINVFNVGGINAYSNLQLAWMRDYTNPTLYARIGESTNYSDWKTLAFTDSTVEAANRLANKVSLWGNEFDGTQSLSGRIAFNKGFAAMSVPIEDGGSNIEFLYVNPDGHLLLGQGIARKEKNTLIYGNNIKFCYGTVGTSAQTAMTITEGGNIEIAGANNVYTRKLAVGIGSTHIISTTTGVPALGTPAANSLLVGSVHYGLQIGTDTNSEASFIQAQRFDSADAKTLNLNPRGGAVNVGGNTVLAKIVSFTTGETYYNRAGANYLWAPKEGGHFVIGVGANVGDAYASLSIYDYAVRPGSRNDAVSLGTSSYRWSNVYSTLGDFNGAVTIRSNADGAELLRLSTDRPWKFSQLGTGAAAALCLSPDATSKSFIIADSDTSNVFEFWVSESNSSANFNSKLTVAKLATFNGSALIPTGQKMFFGTNGSTIEYDADANAIKVTGNIYATGTVASGGKADAQQGGTGGNAEVYKYDLDWGEQVYEIQNVKGDVNVNVQVYEWNGNGNSWDMILTDVSVTANIITVTFGSPTSVDHMVTVV